MGKYRVERRISNGRLVRVRHTVRTWTVKEDETLTYGYASGLTLAEVVASLPGRTEMAVKWRKHMLGLTLKHWTAQEDEELRRGVREFPGRSDKAIAYRAYMLCLQDRKRDGGGALMGAHAPWTAEEDALLRNGALTLPGRTKKSVDIRRGKLGLTHEARRWTPAEDALALAGAKELPGRSEARVRSRLWYLQNKHKKKKVKP